MAKRGRPAKSRKIESGGITQLGTARERLDIVLQSPEIFHFDIAAYMNSYMSASAIDVYNRSRLYDIYASVLLDLHLKFLDLCRIGQLFAGRRTLLLRCKCRDL